MPFKEMKINSLKKELHFECHDIERSKKIKIGKRYTQQMLIKGKAEVLLGKADCKANKTDREKDLYL